MRFNELCTICFQYQTKITSFKCNALIIFGMTSMWSDQNQIAFKNINGFSIFRCYKQWFYKMLTRRYINGEQIANEANKKQNKKKKKKTHEKRHIDAECKNAWQSDTSLHKRAECLFGTIRKSWLSNWFYCAVFSSCVAPMCETVWKMFLLEMLDLNRMKRAHIRFRCHAKQVEMRWHTTQSIRLKHTLHHRTESMMNFNITAIAFPQPNK